jgi:hypothetical protein
MSTVAESATPEPPSNDKMVVDGSTDGTVTVRAQGALNADAFAAAPLPHVRAIGDLGYRLTVRASTVVQRKLALLGLDSVVTPVLPPLSCPSHLAPQTRPQSLFLAWGGGVAAGEGVLPVGTVPPEQDTPSSWSSRARFMSSGVEAARLKAMSRRGGSSLVVTENKQLRAARERTEST